jgi:hypothetical protein
MLNLRKLLWFLWLIKGVSDIHRYIIDLLSRRGSNFSFDAQQVTIFLVSNHIVFAHPKFGVTTKKPYFYPPPGPGIWIWLET